MCNKIMYPTFLRALLTELAIVVTTIIVVAVFRNHTCRDQPRIEISDVKMNTGDIVGVSYSKSFGFFVSAWSNSIWSHVGVIWKDPRDMSLYVIEAAYYREPLQGVICIPLNLWLQINKRSVLGYRRLSGDLDSNRLYNAYQNRRETSLDTFNTQWYRLLWKRSYFVNHAPESTCYEFVIRLLQDCGVMRPMYEASSYFPGDIMNQDLELSLGYRYSETFQINKDLLSE